MSRETELKERLLQKISPRIDYTYDDSYYRNSKSYDKDYERYRGQESTKRRKKIEDKDTKRRNRIMKFSGGSDEFNELFNKLYNYEGEFRSDSGRRWDSDSQSYVKDTKYQDMEAKLYALAGREGINVDKLLRKYKRTDRVTDRRETNSRRKDNRQDLGGGEKDSWGYTDGRWKVNVKQGNRMESNLYEADSRKGGKYTDSWSMLDKDTKKLIEDIPWSHSAFEIDDPDGWGEHENRDLKNEFINKIFLGNANELERILDNMITQGGYNRHARKLQKNKDAIIDSLVNSPHWGEDLNKLDGKESDYRHMDYNEETGELDDDWAKKYTWNRVGGERDYGSKASFRKKHHKPQDQDITRREVDRPLVDSDREVYRRKDPSTGEFKYYTRWSLGGFGGKEREISKKRYWKISDKMSKRQRRVRGSRYKEVEVND